MRLLLVIFGILVAAAGIGTPVAAQNYPWCANFADGAGVNCGFSTYQQCMATSQGSGGFCTQNDAYRPSRAPEEARHPPRTRHPRKKS